MNAKMGHRPLLWDRKIYSTILKYNFLGIKLELEKILGCSN
jgi:hypothetical protein